MSNMCFWKLYIDYKCVNIQYRVQVLVAWLHIYHSRHIVYYFPCQAARVHTAGRLNYHVGAIVPHL